MQNVQSAMDLVVIKEILFMLGTVQVRKIQILTICPFIIGCIIIINDIQVRLWILCTKLGAKTANQQRKIVETAGHQRKIAETKKNIT